MASVKTYDDTVLATGPGANYVKRPKLAAIVNAFNIEGGRSVRDGIRVAVDSLPDLKSKNAETPEGKAKYLRSYLSQLINAEALTVVSAGTAPEPAPVAEGEAKPKKSRSKKNKDQEQGAEQPAEGAEGKAPEEQPAEE